MVNNKEDTTCKLSFKSSCLSFRATWSATKPFRVSCICNDTCIRCECWLSMLSFPTMLALGPRVICHRLNAFATASGFTLLDSSKFPGLWVSRGIKYFGSYNHLFFVIKSTKRPQICSTIASGMTFSGQLQQSLKKQFMIAISIRRNRIRTY